MEHQLGHPVIKVFNNLYAEQSAKIGKPSGTPDRIALLVSADSAKATAPVMEPLNDRGFDAVDAGGSDDSTL